MTPPPPNRTARSEKSFQRDPLHRFFLKYDIRIVKMHFAVMYMYTFFHYLPCQEVEQN